MSYFERPPSSRRHKFFPKARENLEPSYGNLPQLGLEVLSATGVRVTLWSFYLAIVLAWVGIFLEYRLRWDCQTVCGQAVPSGILPQPFCSVFTVKFISYAPQDTAAFAPYYYPPPFAHARPCLSTGWALNRRFEEIMGPLFLWSRMEDWVSVERLYRGRGAHPCL